MSRTRFLIIGILLAMFFTTPVAAQYPYGKNKVIYQSRDWKVLRTDHVDIYHYAADANLIRYVAPLVEDTFNEFSETFDVEFARRLPFVFYATHYDFQQTNILPYMISEYTGGFTDLAKGRIAVPFTGSYADLRHVVRHEMVHAFMLEKLRQVAKEHGRHTYQHPPLWFVEGMAEYFAASPQNRRGNMFVRDALVHNRLLGLEDIWRIQGSFMMYKQGEAVVNYIGTNFGQEAVVQILENWWTADKFTFVLENTINMNLSELSESYLRHTKRVYYPEILHKGFAAEIGLRLTKKKSFHSRPAAHFNDQGDVVVLSLCAQDYVINICELSVPEGGRWKERRIVRGSRDPGLESIPAFRSKLEVHGDSLLFVAKDGDHDIVYVWSTSRRKAIAQYSFKELSLIQSPTLSGDHKRMVFSAIDTLGIMDLYRYHIADDRLERLTLDGFSEEDPDYHPTEEVVLFTSDRGAGETRERTHIYRIDLETREIVGVEGGAHQDSHPEWAPDGESFLFTSDREGTQNIYHHQGNVIVRQTNSIGGVTAASFLPDGTGFVAAVYEAGEFALYQFPIRNGTGRLVRTVPPDTTYKSWTAREYIEEDFNIEDYSTAYTIDFVGVGVSVDPEFGQVGNGGQIVLSDLLGNQQLQMFFGSTTNDFDAVLQRVNVGITWVNRSRRIGYSLSLFRLNALNRNDFIVNQEEKRVGGAVGLFYPLNKFQRIDASLVVRQLERRTQTIFDLDDTRKSFTSSLFLTWVEDRTLWKIGGPAIGWRYYITAGQTVDFLGRGFSNTLLFIDIRQYMKVTERSSLAFRLITRNTFGSDEQIFYLGGPWTLRGYGFREFFGRSSVLVNSEIRFPFIDRFALGFPFGLIEIPMFRASLFFDVGQVTRNVAPVFDTDWLGSFGVGVELNLGFAPVVRVNFTRITDFDKISPDTGFELFIGYNY